MRRIRRFPYELEKCVIIQHAIQQVRNNCIFVVVFKVEKTMNNGRTAMVICAINLKGNIVSICQAFVWSYNAMLILQMYLVIHLTFT